ncbi:MAG: hypothetical protein SFY66_22290 [Oculatellaceae cyanobacterium bins.114]|nr:hypothetical protein [Oculatellaceae cyanobacterium bins.114]
MSVDQPSSQSNPTFPTPKPEELQSQESQAAVRERLLAQQGGETKPNPSPTDEPVMDNNADVDRTLENRLDETGLGLSAPPPPD